MNDKIRKQIDKLSDQKSVVKFELTSNTRFIVLYKSGADFWNATLNSALFLRFWLKLNSRLNLTNDKYYKIDSRPYLAIHNNGIEKVKTKLMAAKCEPIESSNGVLIYWMPEEVAPNQLEKWYADVEVVGQKLDEYFLTGTGEVAVYNLLRGLYGEIVVMDRKIIG